MKVAHKKLLNLGHPLRNLAGQPNYNRIPKTKEILEELLNGMAKFKGTCWCPVDTIDKDGNITSYSLMLNQCPKACGDVWRINIKDGDVAAWLVNEINQRRHK